jgi:sugar lactone lactonase YvrE
MPKPRLSERQKAIFLGALVATLGVVLAINWASRRITDLYGPSVMAQTSDGRVWLLLNHELHVLDRYGTTVRRIPARALGIAPPIADLAPAPDGAVWVGSRETGLLHMVDANGALRASVDPAAAGGTRFFGAFHILPLPGTQDFVVSDTSNHRVVRLGRDGRVQRAFGSTDGQPGTLHFPNGLALDGEGRILLVDTNHHEVRALTQDLEPVPAAGFAARADRGYVWPALIGVAPDGSRFVSIMRDGMERGRVFKLDATGKRLAELEMPQSADPSGLLVRSDDVLVGDQNGLAVRRYGLDGAALGTFGDDSLEAAYREVDDLRRLYRRTIAGGQILLVLVLLGLLLLLRRERRAQEQLGASLAVQVVEHAKPGVFRYTSFSFWVALRIFFAVLAVNVIANLALWNLAHPVSAPALAAIALDFLLVGFLPSAVAVWHFDRMLLAGKYSDILAYGTQKLLRRLGGGLEKLLQPGEAIEGLALAGNMLGPVQLLALTPRRFLVLTLRASLRDLARVQDVPRVAVSRASSRTPRVPFWLRLLGKLRTTALEIRIGGAQHVFQAIDPTAAAELARALSSTAKGAGAGVAHLRDVAPEGGTPERYRAGAVVPLILSAIFPGLGQLRQQRLGMAMITLLCAASWLLQMMGPVIVMVRKTAEVSPLLPTIAIAGYAFVWALSMLDTYLAVRAEAR